MLYFMRGYMPIMYKRLKPRTFRLLSGMGYGVGSLLMMAGGVLMLVKVSERAGEEETAPLPHQKARCVLYLSAVHGTDDMGTCACLSCCTGTQPGMPASRRGIAWSRRNTHVYAGSQQRLCRKSQAARLMPCRSTMTTLLSRRARRQMGAMWPPWTRSSGRWRPCWGTAATSWTGTSRAAGPCTCRRRACRLARLPGTCRHVSHGLHGVRCLRHPHRALLALLRWAGTSPCTLLAHAAQAGGCSAGCRDPSGRVTRTSTHACMRVIPVAALQQGCKEGGVKKPSWCKHFPAWNGTFQAVCMGMEPYCGRRSGRC